jgi:hypothetical protein
MDHELNKWLEGYGFIRNEPMYRLVWSNDIMEYRYGQFRDFAGSIFLREVWETRLTRKYNYIHDKWILEGFSPDAFSQEIPGSERGDYVPIYVFQDRKGGSLPVTRRVLEFLIGALNGRIEKDKIPSKEYLEEKEVKEMEEEMDDHPGWFSTRPGPQRNSVAYGGKVNE